MVVGTGITPGNGITRKRYHHPETVSPENGITRPRGGQPQGKPKASRAVLVNAAQDPKGIHDFRNDIHPQRSNSSQRDRAAIRREPTTYRKTDTYQAGRKTPLAPGAGVTGPRGERTPGRPINLAEPAV